jgi:beta-phosphoglucomutase
MKWKLKVYLTSSYYKRTVFSTVENYFIMNTPKAIIFDLDGVLTDTSEYHYQAWKHLADDEGIPFTQEENDAHLRGVGRRDSLMYLLKGRKVSEEQMQEMMGRKNRYYTELIKNMSPKEVVAGGVDLLKEIRQAGINTAIASASRNTTTVLQRLEITSYFDGIADGNSVVNGKPAPDVFVFAAGIVNTSVVDCLGIEDANAGIEAIKAAGMMALGIGPKERFPKADKVMDNLENKNLQDLLA